MRTQQVLLVLPLAIYTRYSTRSSHVNLGSIYDLLLQLVIPIPLVVGPCVSITQTFSCHLIITLSQRCHSNSHGHQS